MNPKLFWLFTAILLISFNRAEAQQPQKKITHIGFLHSVSPDSAVKNREACLQVLTELGYVEGKNIRYEYRYAEGKLDRLPELATDLARLKVDVIVTGPGTAAARAAKVATATIPIVAVVVTDPVGSGLMTSLSPPGRKPNQPDVRQHTGASRKKPGAFSPSGAKRVACGDP